MYLCALIRLDNKRQLDLLRGKMIICNFTEENNHSLGRFNVLFICCHRFQNRIYSCDYCNYVTCTHFK